MSLDVIVGCKDSGSEWLYGPYKKGFTREEVIESLISEGYEFLKSSNQGEWYEHKSIKGKFAIVRLNLYE